MHGVKRFMSSIIDESIHTETKTVLDNAEMIKELSALLAVEYDLVSAYQEVIQRIESKSFIPKLEQCVLVHQSHIEHLTTFITESGGKLEAQGDYKTFLTNGYIAVSALFGDFRLLSAMQQNLKVAVHFYLKAHQKFFPGNIQLVLKQQLGQTRRHIVQFETWLETLDKDA